VGAHDRRARLASLAGGERAEEVEDLAAALAREPHEVERHLPRSSRARRRWLGAPLRASTTPPGIVLLLTHWSLLHAGLRRRVLQHLFTGSAVIVLDSPRVPMIAQSFARELEQVGLPPGALAVLHDDGRDLLSATLARGGFDVLHAVGHAEDEERLARALGASVLPTGTRPPFGAGVLVGGGPELRFELLRKGEVIVHLDDDPAERAEAVALAALGRAETLGGQLPGQQGRVRCHPRRLSEFTEALLAVLDGDPALADLPPALDPDLPQALLAVRQLGLDEGATLIHEGRPGPDSDSRGPKRNATLSPLVFTNVEPGMRIAALERPMPLLLLSREGPEEAGARRYVSHAPDVVDRDP
jgi:aldehyde dehydrogenase (NAD+)